jgi:aspartate 1-decarboxylase
MLIEMLTGKLHQATVTECDLHYEGSIAIDIELLEAGSIRVYQKVDVYNINNGQRFSTYAIAAPRGSRTIGVNGAAARLCQRGDRIIVAAFAHMDAAEARDHRPSVIVLDERNEPVAVRT